MNKTLYIRPQDRGVWAQAELLAAGNSISGLCTLLLAAWLNEKDPDGKLRETLSTIRQQIVSKPER